MTTEEQKAWKRFSQDRIDLLSLKLGRGLSYGEIAVEAAKYADAMMEKRKARMG